MSGEKISITLNQRQDLYLNAKRYCYLIENIDEFEHPVWLSEISHILPCIHAVIGLIDQPKRKESLFAVSDIDERFELFCQLKKLLGEMDGYEIGEELLDNELYGSLSGDLTDLYFEIKRGLELLRFDSSNLPDALNLWRDGFYLHWGSHLINAEKHLHDLRVHHQI